MVRSSLIYLLLLACSPAFADDGEAPPIFGLHHGYVSDVHEERNKRDLEMVMLDPPAPLPKKKDPVFSDKLSRDFQQQYAYRFGATQAEQILNTAWRSDEYTYSTGQNSLILEQQKKQQDFGEYMARKLIEFHVDDWAKSDPQFKQVYALKDKVSNLNMQVRKGYKFKWKYNFAGPHMDFQLENPYDIEAKTRVEMSGIISEPVEIIYSVGYPVTNRVTVSTLYRQIDGLCQAILTRRMTPSLSTSFTASTDTREEGPSVHQNLFLLGMSWND